MDEKTRTNLLAIGEQELGYYISILDDALRNRNFDFAWAIERQYAGAALMLEKLGLLSQEEYEDRTRASFECYMAARFPECQPKEAARS